MTADAADTPSDTDHLIERAAEILDDAERIGTLGHVGPDGDAIGSSWGIALSARAAGKEAFASFGEPFVVPHQFRFLPQDVLVPPAEFPADLDVVVACDTASPDRLGSVAAQARSAGKLIVLDHHRSNGGFGDVEVVDPTAASTAQLAYVLLGRLGWPMTRDVARCLYTGIVTDTGRFQYSATDAGVLRIAADLLELGVEPDEVGRHVYEEAPFGYLSVVSAVLGRTELDRERSMVWSVLFEEDLDEAGIAYEEADGLIDEIRIAEEAEVAVLLKRLDEKQVKGSLRSRGAVDVSVIAGALGGGGHHNAAGFTAAGDPDAVMGRIRELLDGASLQ